ncbi:MAG: hypothetical protein ACFFA8_05855 [Promethearchaeota archaeon]
MILLTGFEKFGKYSNNISQETVKVFPQILNNIEFKKLILPVDWDASLKKYITVLNFLNKELDLVLLTGIHSGKKFYLELYAWNFRLGKDENHKYKFGFIKFGKPLRVKSNIDIDQLIYSFEKKTQISISSTPNFYLCNFIYYWALILSQDKYPVTFLHIPKKENLNNCIEIIEKITIKLIQKI